MKFFANLFILTSILVSHSDKSPAQNVEATLRTSPLHSISADARTDTMSDPRTSTADSGSSKLCSHAIIFAGITSPGGDFSSHTTGTSSAGAAKTGFNVGTDLGIDISSGFELGFTTSFNFLPSDEQSSSIEADWWKLYDLLGTISGFTMSSKDLRFYGRGYFGVSFSTYPTQEYRYDQRIMRYSTHDVSPRYGIGGGVRLFNKFDLNIRFLWANAEYKGETYYYPHDAYPTSSEYSFKQSLTTIQLSVGMNILTLQDRRVSQK